MTTTKFRTVPVHVPKPGDVADHKSRELDPRRVSRVEGELIWLDLLTTEAGPFPRANYTFKRRIPA